MAPNAVGFASLGLAYRKNESGRARAMISLRIRWLDRESAARESRIVTKANFLVSKPAPLFQREVMSCKQRKLARIRTTLLEGSPTPHDVEPEKGGVSR